MLTLVLIYETLLSMASELYGEALKKAQQELADCDAAVDELERKRAKLRQTIVSLQSLMGVQVEQDQSLTDAILMTIRATPGYSRCSDVVRRLHDMGYRGHGRSVATILSRLAKTGQIVHDTSPDHATGYTWRTDTTKGERLEAKKTLAKKSGK